MQERYGHTAHTLNLCYEVFLVSLHGVANNSALEQCSESSMLALSSCDNKVSGSFGMHELRNRGNGAPIQLPIRSKLGFHVALLLALLAAVSY